MAKIGDIKQYQGPFTSEQTISIEYPCVLGISVDEKDFMKAGSESADSSIEAVIKQKKGNQIVSSSLFIGRTFIYQTQEQYDIISVQFPEGAPASTLLTIVNCAARPETDSD